MEPKFQVIILINASSRKGLLTLIKRKRKVLMMQLSRRQRYQVLAFKSKPEVTLNSQKSSISRNLSGNGREDGSYNRMSSTKVVIFGSKSGFVLKTSTQ